ncbi:MAG: hypothetical protein HY646_21920, partial [Acidobacteria bacterium]|nr:hypothetical protein [Acidobacteriota bacterium]
MKHTRLLIALVLMLASTAALAQFGRPRWSDFGFSPDYNQDVPNTEFVFARWQYSRGRGWAHDYPDAEQHINQIMDEATLLNVERMS